MKRTSKDTPDLLSGLDSSAAAHNNARVVREAQRARGLDRHPLALAVPLVLRTLKMADEVAEAIEARS